jgi:hypothetical protein
MATSKKGKNIKTPSLPYVIIRTAQAGVFAGELLAARTGNEVELLNARRLWYWDGAASLSQLAMEGVSKPQNCKFPPEVIRITLLGVIEVIEATTKARESIAAVKPWRA